MKRVVILTAAVALTGLMTGCGRNANTLPPIPYYANQAGPTQQLVGSQPLGGNTGNNPNASTLPNDVAQGQVGSIVGRVVNKSGRPLHNVDIYVESTPSIKTKSNKGEFTLLNVPAGSQTLVFKVAGTETKMNANVVPNTASPPEQNPVLIQGDVSGGSLEVGNPNRQAATFQVDQALLNKWQPKGLVVSQGTIYISAIDVKSLIKKGSVLKMDANSGKSWKDLAAAWLGLRHPMDATSRGIAMNNGNVLLIADEKSGVYNVETAKGKVTRNKADGALDIAAGGDKVYVYSQRGLETADSTGVNRTLVAKVNPTGGIGADNKGNGYAPIGNTVHKVDSATGKSAPLITDHLSSPIDVAVDPRNGDVFVLDGNDIKRFDANGQFVVAFPSGAQEGVAITVDEAGCIYVADFGTDNRSAKVIKYEASPLVSPTLAAAPATATPATTDTAATDETATAADEAATDGLGAVTE